MLTKVQVLTLHGQIDILFCTNKYQLKAKQLPVLKEKLYKMRAIEILMQTLWTL